MDLTADIRRLIRSLDFRVKVTREVINVLNNISIILIRRIFTTVNNLSVNKKTITSKVVVTAMKLKFPGFTFNDTIKNEYVHIKRSKINRLIRLYTGDKRLSKDISVYFLQWLESLLTNLVKSALFFLWGTGGNARMTMITTFLFSEINKDDFYRNFFINQNIIIPGNNTLAL